MADVAYTPAQAQNEGIKRKYHDNGDGSHSETVWTGGGSVPTGASTEAKQDTANTRLGDLTETAPASDTASSGLNGRLQRIAQRVTSLIALLPTALTSGGRFKTAIQEFTGAANLANAQVTLSSTSIPVAAARATRRSVVIRNTDAANSCYVGTGTVTSGNGFLLKAGEAITLDTTAAVNGIRATADVVVCYAETYD